MLGIIMTVKARTRLSTLRHMGCHPLNDQAISSSGRVSEIMTDKQSNILCQHYTWLTELCTSWSKLLTCYEILFHKSIRLSYHMKCCISLNHVTNYTERNWMKLTWTHCCFCESGIKPLPHRTNTDHSTASAIGSAIVLRPNSITWDRECRHSHRYSLL